MNARYPGSTHDSFIWKSVYGLHHLRQEHDRRPNNGLCMLGDSGYPLQPWLMIPILNPSTQAEKYYNKMHASTRSKVERCIGLLKIRFRALLGERKLRYSHEKTANIIISCVILNNFINAHNFDFDLQIQQDPGNIHNDDPNPDDQPCLEEAKQIRKNLVESLYATRPPPPPPNKVFYFELCLNYKRAR